MRADKDIATILWHSPPQQVSKNGHWRIRYGYRDSAGAEHQTTETVATPAKRDQFVAYLEREINAAIAPKKAAPVSRDKIRTVEDLLATYAEVAKQKHILGKKDGWGNKTYMGNMGLINNYIIPQMGDMHLWEVTAADVRNALDRIGTMERAHGNHKGTSKATDNSRVVYDCKKIISKAFWWCVEQELIDPAANPMLGVKIAPPKSKHRNVIPEALLATALDIARDSDPEMYLLLVVVAMLSSRCGEIFGLRWQDLDHDSDGRPIVHINKELTTCDRDWIGATRSKGIIEVIGNPPSTSTKSKRIWALKKTKTEAEDELTIDYIYITKDVEELLLAHKASQAIALKNAAYDMGFIFTENNGWPIAGVALKRFRKLLKAAGCSNPEDYDLYCMRHYSITKKLSYNGQNYVSVAQDTKHLEVDTMMKYYESPEASVRQRTADALSKFLLRSKSEQPEVDTDADADTEQLIAAARELCTQNPQFKEILEKWIAFWKQASRNK